jgi:hypothetical protein
MYMMGPGAVLENVLDTVYQAVKTLIIKDTLAVVNRFLELNTG